MQLDGMLRRQSLFEYGPRYHFLVNHFRWEQRTKCPNLLILRESKSACFRSPTELFPDFPNQSTNALLYTQPTIMFTSFRPGPSSDRTSVFPPSSPSSPPSTSLARQSCPRASSSHPQRQHPKLSHNQHKLFPKRPSNILDLSDLEYSFNFPTKCSKSSSLPFRFSKLRFCNSGLYFKKSSSSVGET